MTNIALNSPGPIANGLLHSNAFVKIGIGPVGSGKTLTALQCGLATGVKQKGKRDANGVVWRKCRIGVLRESYPNIDANILPSWWRIQPKEMGKWNGKAPYTHHFRKALRTDPVTGKPIDVLDCTYEFRAIGDQSVQEVMRGWEINALIVDETDLQPKEILAYASGRVGRFSDLDPATVVDPQIVLVSNMPWVDNWLFELAFKGNLEDLLSADELALLQAAMPGRKLVETFVQPGGRDPAAENLHNLPNGRGYYDIQAALNKADPDHVDRMIDNKPVPRRYGQPVYPDFRHHLHISKTRLVWDPDRPLIIGLDQGLNAAAVAMQRTIQGEIRVLREVVKFKDKGQKVLSKIGPTAFGKMVARLIVELAPEITPDMLRVVADPAAFPSEKREDDEHNWVLAVQGQLPAGVRIRRAKSQSPTLRQEAIRNKQIEAGGYLVDPSCKMLITAHLGKYHFVKQQMKDDDERGDTIPVFKNIWSNVADAEQYAALEGELIIQNLRGRTPKRRSGRGLVTVAGDYDYFGG
jgi:hypothetical protein